MRAMVGVALVVGFAAADAVGGTVSFDPPVAMVAPGETAEYLVTVESTDLTQFDSISLLLSSHVEGLDLSFVYDSSLEVSLDTPVPAPSFVFPTDLFVGGNDFGLWQAPVVVGRLRIDTTNLASGRYDDVIGARPDEEAEIFGAPVSAVGLGLTGATETLSGTAGLVISGGTTDAGGGGDGGAAGGDSTDDSIEDPADEPAEDATDTSPEEATEPTDTGGDVIADGTNLEEDQVDQPADIDDDRVGDAADSGPASGGVAGDEADDHSPQEPHDTAVGDIENSSDPGPGDDNDGIDGADEPDPGVGSSVGGGFCGAAMLGAFLCLLAGLATLKLSRPVSRNTG